MSVQWHDVSLGFIFLQLPDISNKIPSNAEVITHPNSCYDWGTIGWLLESGRVDTLKYKYFLFMNSSVRGPFIPTFSQVPSLPLPRPPLSSAAHLTVSLL